MAEYENAAGAAQVSVGDGDHGVLLGVAGRSRTLTPGEANAIATALQEAALVATSNAKEEAARKAALAADRGPKHEEMF
jgi:hypothetical protein